MRISDTREPDKPYIRKNFGVFFLKRLTMDKNFNPIGAYAEKIAPVFICPNMRFLHRAQPVFREGRTYCERWLLCAAFQDKELGERV